MKNQQPAYKDTSLEDRENEIWRDIPRLKGAFQVSCFGRIKRLANIRIDNNGRVFKVSPKILKLHVHKGYNKLRRDYTYSLITLFRYNRKWHSFPVNRLVYYLFVAHFNQKDFNLVIGAKNSDRFDIRPENLVLENRSDLAKRSFKIGRRKNHWENKSFHKTEAFKQSVAARKVQVSCYDENGRLVETYDSVRQAAFTVNAQESCISTALKNPGAKSIGYYWRRGSANMINFKELNEYHRGAKKERAKVKGFSIRQYNLDGTFVCEYTNISKAAKATGINYGSIWQSIFGRQTVAGGFRWETGAVR